MPKDIFDKIKKTSVAEKLKDYHDMMRDYEEDDYEENSKYVIEEDEGANLAPEFPDI